MQIYTNIHTRIHTYMFVVVNFDALAQASDIRIERRQVFLYWMQDSNPRSQPPIRQQTECLLTNRLSYRGSNQKSWTRQPVPMISKHSAHPTSLPVGFRTWLWRYTCLLMLISMLWHRQAIFEWKGDKLSSSAECRIRTQGLIHIFTRKLNACWQTDCAIEDQAKKIELDSPSLWPASIRPTRPHCQLALLTHWSYVFLALTHRYDMSILISGVIESAQYIPMNVHTVWVLVCIAVVKYQCICPYLSGLLNWHWNKHVNEVNL